jgi:hypothetical protein
MRLQPAAAELSIYRMNTNCRGICIDQAEFAQTHRSRRLFLGSYVLATLVFWVLALGPWDGGPAEEQIRWVGVLPNALCLFPLFRGKRWAVTCLAIESMIVLGVLGPWGIRPSEAFVSLMIISACSQLVALAGLYPPIRNRHSG